MPSLLIYYFLSLGIQQLSKPSETDQTSIIQWNMPWQVRLTSGYQTTADGLNNIQDSWTADSLWNARQSAALTGNVALQHRQNVALTAIHSNVNIPHHGSPILWEHSSTMLHAEKPIWSYCLLLSVMYVYCDKTAEARITWFSLKN